MRLAVLDKSMGNALGYGQQPHISHLNTQVLEQHIPYVYCFCLHFLDCFHGDYPRPCLV